MFNKETIAKLYPEAENLMIEPMLINKGDDRSLKLACESGNYFGQLKKDGAFYQFVKTTNYEYLFGRTVSRTTGILTEKVSNVPHIQNALQALPANTILIGEVYYPNGTSKNTVSIMGCLAPKAIERQNGAYGKIHYYVHDILMYNGIDFVSAETGSWDRYCILEKIWKLHGLDKYDFLELAEVWTDDLYARVGDALAAGEEGMVIKHKDGKYEPGKRPKTNLKAKKVDFADVVIMGFEEPTKEYYGKELDSWGFNILPEGTRLQGTYLDLCEIFDNQVIPVTKPYYYNWHNSRIKIGVYKNGSLVEVGTIHSGISDEMKQDMSEHPEKYLGQVCSIQMMEVDSKAGTIRHGFYKHMRPDKNATDCRYEDVFGQSN